MTHRLVQSQHVHTTVHGSGLAGRFNAWLAVAITRRVGSMWCAYVFAALAIVSLPAAVTSGDPVILVSWISQTFLQLVLLSVIMVGQNVISVAQDARAETDHETLSILHLINEHQLMILEELYGRHQETGN